MTILALRGLFEGEREREADRGVTLRREGVRDSLRSRVPFIRSSEWDRERRVSSSAEVARRAGVRERPRDTLRWRSGEDMVDLGLSCDECVRYEFCMVW